LYRQVDRPSPTRLQLLVWLLRNPSTMTLAAFRFEAGVTIFFRAPFEGRNVERLLSDDVLEAPVFIFELLELPGVAHVHPAVLGLPAVEALLADPVPPAQVLRLGSRLGLPEHPDDLLLGKPLPLHRALLP